MKTESKDPMAIVVLLVGLAVVGVAVWFLVGSLVNTIGRNTTKGADTEENMKVQHALVTERLQRIGMVKAGFVPKVPPVRTGKEIVGDVCGECHTEGSMGAPMIGSSDWAERYERGFASLLKTAQKGKGDMPPRGDDPSLTDKDLMKAIAYMLKESGLTPPVLEPDKKKGEGDKGEATDAPKAGAAAPAADAGAAPAPAAAVPDQSSSAAGASGAGQPVAGMEAMPPFGYNPFDVSALPPEKRGGVVFEMACSGCHEFMPPRTGNREDWHKVAVKGMDALYQSTLYGTFGMPPKGGRLDLSDEDIKASVDYMASLAR